MHHLNCPGGGFRGPGGGFDGPGGGFNSNRSSGKPLLLLALQKPPPGPPTPQPGPQPISKITTLARLFRLWPNRNLSYFIPPTQKGIREVYASLHILSVASGGASAARMH